MHSKTLTIVLFTIILALSTGYFGIRNYIFKEQNIVEKIDEVNQLIEQEEWEQAEVINQELQKIWEQNSNWIQMNFAEQDYSQFEDHLHAIEAGIKAKDIASALYNAREVRTMWKNINKIVPEP